MLNSALNMADGTMQRCKQTKIIKQCFFMVSHIPQLMAQKPIKLELSEAQGQFWPDTLPQNLGDS